MLHICVVRKMQVKTIDTTTDLKWLTSGTLTNAGENVKQQELSCIAGGNAEMLQLLWKTVDQFPANILL